MDATTPTPEQRPQPGTKDQIGTTENNIVISYETYIRFARVRAFFSRLDEYFQRDPNSSASAEMNPQWKDIIPTYSSLSRTIMDLVYYYGNYSKKPPPEKVEYRADFTPYQNYINQYVWSGFRSFYPNGYKALKPLVEEAMNKYEEVQASKLSKALSDPLASINGEHLILLLQEYARRERILDREIKVK